MNQRVIKHFVFYFKKMMKFYELKVQGVPQVIFLLLLAASFGLRVLLQPYITELFIYQQQVLSSIQTTMSQGSLADPGAIEALTGIIFSEEYTQLIGLMFRILGFIFIQQIVIMFLSFFYLGSYMVDQETVAPTLSQYVKKYLKALPRYIVFNLLYFLCAGILFVIIMVVSSFAAMFLPILSFIIILLPIGWFIIQAMFIFKDVTFLDTGVGVFRNFILSLKLSSGNRIIIGKNIFFIVFLNWIIGIISANNSLLVSLFVFSFLEVIVLLIRQRLTALMYLERTRVEKSDIEGD
jgi:hypothetical protein